MGRMRPEHTDSDRSDCLAGADAQVRESPDEERESPDEEDDEDDGQDEENEDSDAEEEDDEDGYSE